MSDLPRFDFSGMDSYTDEEVSKATERKESKVFKPGQYDVVVDQVLAAKDPTDKNWRQIRVVYTAGGKQVSDFIMFPITKTTEFTGRSGKATSMPLIRLKNFMTALGLEVTGTNLKTLLSKTLSNPAQLVGKPLTVRIGYRKAHPKFVRDASNNTSVQIELNDGSVLCDAGGAALNFGNVDALLAHAESNQIEIEQFPNITDYVKSAKPAAAATNW